MYTQQKTKRPIEQIFCALHNHFGRKIKLRTLLSHSRPPIEKEYKAIIEKTGWLPWQYKVLVAEHPKTTHDGDPNHVVYRDSGSKVEQIIKETLSGFQGTLQPINTSATFLFRH